ncbi:unnamed protein product [Arctogadus glacialis]
MDEEQKLLRSCTASRIHKRPLLSLTGPGHGLHNAASVCGLARTHGGTPGLGSASVLTGGPCVSSSSATASIDHLPGFPHNFLSLAWHCVALLLLRGQASVNSCLFADGAADGNLQDSSISLES